MMKRIITASLIGVDAESVSVEINVQQGLPYMHLVGLADKTIKEARERVRIAIVNSGFEYPKKRITVSLSPADIPKEGSHFDLPIAVGILGTVSDRVNTDKFGFIGELSLDGTVNGVKGALPLAICMREKGIKNIVLPRDNAEEVSLLKDIVLYPVSSLSECVAFLSGKIKIDIYKRKENDKQLPEKVLDFADVIGNEAVKRGLVIAAAGNHGVLMMGSPGCGKTMMAKRIPFIMPELEYGERLEVAKIHSAAGLISDDCILYGRRPFRAPHHTITKAALIGGGVVPHPGEISLAHNGVLFLDELGEFNSGVIELLRKPVEEGSIHIQRSRVSVDFPCRIMLVAATNPCKCGYYGDNEHICTCTQHQLESFSSRFSGPMLDRIDLHLMVIPPKCELFENGQKGMSTAQMRELVTKTVERQRQRYKGTGITFNSRLQEDEIKEFCVLEKEGAKFLESAFNNLGLSMRAYNKVLKVSRTIADLSGCDQIKTQHIAEALQYRSLERFYRRDYGNKKGI